MAIFEHLDKKNLHHAYLIEGARDIIVPEIFKFCESINIKTSGNPDFVSISIDNFKINEALELRAMSFDKSFSSSKKIFTIFANTISLDAQNVLLKMFEEPTENSHFFLIVPDINMLLKTVISRFYLIKPENKISDKNIEAKKFIAMPLRDRINFIKELLIEEEKVDEEEGEIIMTDSARASALRFLNSLESTLHRNITPKNIFDTKVFEHFFKVREFLRMPGSSTKSLLESVAMVVPNLLK